MKATIIIAFIVSFIINLIITPLLIPVLKALKAGQTIREIGPKWHEKKGGTPTMGGIGFLVVVTLTCLILVKSVQVKLALVFALLYGIIGFMDDFIKVVLKRNLGLNEKQKLLLQIIVTVLFLLICVNKGYIDTTIWIPFFNITFDFDWFYIIFISVFMIGFTNAVNLTDGLDGLAASVTSIVCIFFVFASYVLTDNAVHLGDVGVFSASLLGALMAFLAFNFHPAKLFMGDTGSLYLGGAVAIFSILLKIELILVLVGIIYVVEAFSVIIQVLWYKTTKKRVFLMAPIHHHFEMKKVKETKIVFAFSLVTLIACIISFISLI